MTEYDYSIDNGLNWDPATAGAGSELTGLTFAAAGTEHNFIWDVKDDIGPFYNIPLKLRFRASTIFGSDTVLTDYKVKALTVVKEITTATINPPSVFPDGYTGTAGTNMTKKVPV